MASPHKQASKLKELKGTLEKSRENHDQIPVVSPEGYINPPTDIGKTGSSAWMVIVERYTNIGALDVLDLLTLSELCYSIDTMAEAKADMKENGKIIVIDGKNGAYETTSPSWKLYNDAFKIFLPLSSRFGLNPADRQKLIFPKQEKENAIDPLDKKRE